MKELGDNVQRALRRPKNFWLLPPRRQWDIDAELGILEWDPTPEEVEQYTKALEIRDP